MSDHYKPTAGKPEPAQCPRCKSEKITSASEGSIRMPPAHKKCEWCGMLFVVNEKGAVVE